MNAAQQGTRAGFLAALTAFSIWGVAPLYWKLLTGVPALETVAHRVVWSLLMLTGVMAWRGGFTVLRRLAGEPRLIGLLALTTTLTAVNWLLFVWAIVNNHVLEASLGYFIAPLINVLLAAIFLRERLHAWQKLAVALACAGVLWRVWHLGTLPWVSLSLAVTFSLYGLLRKRAPIGALDGLFVETLLAAPVALGWLLWLQAGGESHFSGAGTIAALIGTGLITALPLFLYTVGARRLRYTTLGFIQYVGPSLQFAQAVFLFHEPFSHVALISFMFIWAGLAVFSLDALRRARAA
ncbi:EamA family transporter RarD [Uliginosibacterium sp. 31-12]|uniref:EamA family transporter RarD n=1 Tax=Uliginosibacterium sp. 31-12 TaxID=3062781 RepID=UPI0026E3ABC5|nr:EamA family transporter RarD [Uliginosibacterium sp. 31-12]MDO6386365.1 EamA family transporter RarD [Uliginosibacterium sp. 31-12]